MPSPFENDQIEQFLGRLNKPLASMPQQERVKLHLELRQHLDSLIAAHEELGSSRDEAPEAAFRQFDNPRQIGKKLMHEWRITQNRRPISVRNPVWYAVICLFMLAWLSFFFVNTLLGFFGIPEAFAHFALFLALSMVPVIAGCIVGRVLRERSVPIMVRAIFAFVSIPFLVLVFVEALPFTVYPVYPFSIVLVQWIGHLIGALAWLAWWLPLGCGAAYLASAHRRGGFYRLYWSDVRLRFR